MVNVVESRPVVIATIRIVPDTCVTCGLIFGVADDFKAERQHDGHWYYCPNGHAQRYGENAVDVAQRERNAARAEARKFKARAEQLENDLLDKVREAQHVEARLHGGVCPYCHRNFVALGRHMRNKHPEHGS